MKLQKSTRVFLLLSFLLLLSDATFVVINRTLSYHAFLKDAADQGQRSMVLYDLVNKTKAGSPDLLSGLEKKMDLNRAILLKKEFVDHSAFPGYIKRKFKLQPDCDCVVASSTGNEIQEIIRSGIIPSKADTITGKMIYIDGVDFAVSLWPIQEYLGEANRSLPAAGFVVIWKNQSARMQLFHRNQMISLVYALIAYLILEVLLFGAVRFVTSSLEREIKERTVEILKLNERLRFQSNTDELTGLYNRRFFIKRMDEEAKRAERYRETLSLLLLDLDHFKAINDEYGHTVGDLALSSVGRFLREVLRESDIACRYAGEEFCILLPKTSEKDAAIVAEKLRKGIEQIIISSESGKDFHITASFGVAAWKKGESKRFWLSAADESMYRAKKAGRNKVMSRKITPDKQK